MSLMPGRSSPPGGGWRITFVCHEYPPFGGGAATALDAISRELVYRGHRVQIITVGRGWRTVVERDLSQRREVVRLGGGRRSLLTPTISELILSYLTLRWRGFKPLGAFQPQVVVAFFAFPAGHALLSMAIPPQVPLVAWLRGSDVPGFFNARWHWLQPVHPHLVRPVLAKADLLLANGEHLSRLAGAFFPQRLPFAVANGIDPGIYSPGKDVCLAKCPRILAVGQLIARKGLQELLAGMAWLATQEREAHLTIVGDGPLRAHLTALSSIIPLPVTIEWRGHCTKEEMVDIYRDHHVLVHLSKAEGVSNVLLEALACGLPVIARQASTDEGKIVSPAITILTEVTGQSVGKAILHLTDDPQKWLSLSQQARKTAIGFSWSMTASQLEALLKPMVVNNG